MPVTRLQEMHRKTQHAKKLSTFSNFPGSSDLTRMATIEEDREHHEQIPLKAPDTSSVLINQGPKLTMQDPTEHLRSCGVTAKVRRSVYFLLAGMLVYLLSWSSVLCRVTRGIIQYPDRMPTAVWVSTLGILLFYETFILAQCTSMAARIRQIMAGQRPALQPSNAWANTGASGSDLARCSVLRAFYVQARGLKHRRDSFYLGFVHFLSMPDWESIAFLAGGVTIDLVSAVLYSVPFFRDDLFGLPKDQQRAEPWATMAFLVLVWLLTVTISSWWEKYRHMKQSPQLAKDNDMWDFDTAKSQEEELDARLSGVESVTRSPNSFRFGFAPCMKPVRWMERLGIKCMRKLDYTTWAAGQGTEESNASNKSNGPEDPATDAQGPVLLHSLQGLNVTAKLLLAFVIYVLIGSAVFIGWGFVMKLWIESSALPWMIVLLVLATLLFRKMYSLGQWRLRAHYNENPPELGPEDLATKMAKFRTYHLAAAGFHCLLIGMTLYLGTLNSDLDWAEDYIALQRPAYFMTPDYKQMSDIQDNTTLKTLLTAQAQNSSDPFLGIQGATQPKIGIGYCATKQPLQLYFLYICMAWSLCSAIQHWLSAQRIKQYENKPSFKYTTAEYGLLLASFTVLLITPAIQRYGANWQPILLFFVLLPVVALAAQVVALGVFDLFDDADATLASTASSVELAKLALRDVRCYKWVEYTLSATAMHVVVTYIGGVLSAHELVLSAGALATSMLFCNFSDSALHSAEQPDRATGRKPSVITVSQTIDCEMPFIFLSFFAKGVLCVALTVPWVFVSRQDYVVQPIGCS